MSDPVSQLKQELLAAAAREHGATVLLPNSHRRWRLAALAAAALVAVVGTAAAVGSVRDFILDRGFIGLPPEGATPSEPESGELVVHWMGRSATHSRAERRGCCNAPLVRAWVYADGRMIWSREGSVPEGANRFTSGYLEQRLTPEGVERLRTELVGLFYRTRMPLETLADDRDWVRESFGGLALFVPGDHAFRSPWGSVLVRDGARLVRLQWHGIGAETGSQRFYEILDDLRQRFDGPVATPEQLPALRRVDALLTDPARVLPSSAWADREIRAYVPSHYAVCMATSPPKQASQLLSLLPPAAAQVLRGKTRTREDGEVVEAREAGRTVVLGRSVTYCSKLTTDDSREVASALSGLEPRTRHSRLAYLVAEPIKNLNPTEIWFEPYFPHGEYTCSACG